MNFAEIFTLLETFSNQHGFEYDNTPLPYIPFGGIRGVFHGCKVNMYIYQTGSSVENRLHTLFAVLENKIIPKGFCIEYTGKPYRQNKPFEQQISILSYDATIVKNFLNKNLETQFMDSFGKIDEIDTSIFKVRSNLRINEEGFSLTV